MVVLSFIIYYFTIIVNMLCDVIMQGGFDSEELFLAAGYERPGAGVLQSHRRTDCLRGSTKYRVADTSGAVETVIGSCSWLRQILI